MIKADQRLVDVIVIRNPNGTFALRGLYLVGAETSTVVKEWRSVRVYDSWDFDGDGNLKPDAVPKETI